MVRIERSDLRNFLELIKDMYGDELKNAEIQIIETIDNGFVIRYKNIIKRIRVDGLTTGFNIDYNQLCDLYENFFCEDYIEFNLRNNKEWFLKIHYKNNTIKVERNTSKFKFNYDIRFEVKWLELANLIKNNEEFKIIRWGFGTKDVFNVKFNPDNKEKLIMFICSDYGDNYITVKVKDDYEFLFENNHGTSFKVCAEAVDYIKED